VNTSEIITVEKCTNMWTEYKKNWSRKGIHQNAHSYFSESGEDGICEHIFDVIGTRSKYYLEFGAWDGTYLSNTAFFRTKKNWTGLLLDGGYENAEINLHKHFLTAENITDLFAKYLVPEEFDLLSVDIDGNDYWLLEKILAKYHPRVLVLETNQLISPKIAATVAYNPEILWDVNDRYFGASASAFDNLGKKHGYTMVGMHDQNVFLVQSVDAVKFSNEIEGLGEIEKLFKPRVPRWYLNENQKRFELSKYEVHGLAYKGQDVTSGTPLIEKAMKNFVSDGPWVLL